MNCRRDILKAFIVLACLWPASQFAFADNPNFRLINGSSTLCMSALRRGVIGLMTCLKAQLCCVRVKR